MSVRKRAWSTWKGERRRPWSSTMSPDRQAATQDILEKEGRRQFRRQQRMSRSAPAFTPPTAQACRLPKLEALDPNWRGAGLERATIETYRQHVRLHIEPYLGNMKLSQLSAPMVREFMDRLARGDMPDGADPQPRSPAMVRKDRDSLSSLLSDAQERGLVIRNVVRELRNTRNRGAERKAEKHQKGKLKIGVDIPAREEIKAIVAAATGRWRPLSMTMIFTGLRASELRRIRWADVDHREARATRPPARRPVQRVRQTEVLFRREDGPPDADFGRTPCANGKLRVPRGIMASSSRQEVEMSSRIPTS